MRPHRLLLFGAAGHFKCILCVTGKAAGKITTIVRIVAPRHRNFVAVVHHRCAAHGKQKRVREFEPIECRALLIHEAQHVVRAKQCEQRTVRVAIDMIA